jgi:hypothetical protein
MSAVIGNVAGLSKAEQDELDALVQVWNAKAGRNDVRQRYYDSHNRLKDLKVSIPPSLATTETVVGWPAKAVNALAQRSIFDGFVTSGADQDPLGLRDLLRQNHFKLLYREAVTSELVHSCSFVTVTMGQAGEPDILLSLRSARFASAIWDMRARRIRSGMAVTDVDRDNRSQPTEVTLYLADAVIICESRNGRWTVAEKMPNPLGRPLMEPLVFQPSLDRPFGHSRVSREVMSITDSAVRQALRMEVLSEFNTSPQRYVLGAQDDIFADGKWSALMSTILGLGDNWDNADSNQRVTVGQFPQVSNQGALNYMSQLASRFAGVTGLPVASLGIVSDNPSSAQAIGEARDDLITEAESLNESNRVALENVGRMAVALRDGLDIADLPDEVASIQANFRNPARPSISTQSDAIIKQISAIPWLAESEVVLEELGYSESQITRLLADKRRSDGGSLLDKALATARAGVSNGNLAAGGGIPAGSESDTNSGGT